jgi:hypothetical protein
MRLPFGSKWPLQVSKEVWPSSRRVSTLTLKVPCDDSTVTVMMMRYIRMCTGAGSICILTVLIVVVVCCRFVVVVFLVTLVKRGMAPATATTFEPMSDKLVARMQQILNAEITGLVSIPLVAAFMARGVLYWDDFPWQAGAAFTVVATGGASFFYAKQALTWKDN